MEELVIRIVNAIISTNYFKTYLEEKYNNLYKEIYENKINTRNETFITKIIEIYNEYAKKKKDCPSFDKLYKWSIINKNAQTEQDEQQNELWKTKK